MIEGQMPANVDAEKFVLASVLLDNATYYQASSLIRADDFSLDSNRRIFLRMSELADGGQPIDYQTLSEKLAQHKELEIIGGVDYLFSFMNPMQPYPRVKNISSYARTVRDKSLLRLLIHCCSRQVRAAMDEAESAGSMISRAVDDLLSLQTGISEDPQQIKEFSDEAAAALKASWDNLQTVNRYSLALEGMDSKTGGMLAEEYICLMGRTGDGKSGYASQIALRNGLKGKPVLIFPLELSREVMWKRMLCQVSKVSNQVIIKRTLEPLESERTKIDFAKRVLDEAPIYFDDSHELNIAQLVAKARQWKRRHCQHPEDGVVIVDYMQKVVSKFRENRDKITQVSEGLRRLAKDERMRVLGLSQMARPEGKNLNARPTKFDPKESGSIENDVHLLLSVYRPVDDHKMPTGADELIICKQRDGESAIEDVEYRGEIYTFIPRGRA